MKQRKFSISKQKSYLTAGVITLAAVIAMAGIYYKDKSGEQRAEKEAIVMAETEKTEETSAPENTSGEGESINTESKTEKETEKTDLNSQDEHNSNRTQTSDESSVGQALEEAEGESKKEDVETAAPAEPELHFSAADKIGWPINGDVVLNYSMDKSIYFATLDQYKYNPAIVIQGDVNDKVVASADGQVISVDTNAETGVTVTVGMGDDYQAVYGQLKEVELAAGDYISRGDTIGYINEPTKYYSVEGSNLYFAMTKNGNPVNPLDYFE